MEKEIESTGAVTEVSLDIESTDSDTGGEALQEAPSSRSPRWAWTRSLSSFLLMALVFLLPIAFLPSIPLGLAKTSLAAVVAGILFFLWTLSALRNGSFFMPFWSKSYFLIAAILLAIVTTISALFSHSIGSSFMGSALDVGTAISVIVGTLLLLFTSRILKTKEQIFTLYVAFFASAGLIALFQLCRLIFGANFLSFGVLTDPASNLIGNWTEVGIFFGLTAVVTLITLETLALGKWSRIIAGVALVVSLFFVFLVNSFIVPIVLAVFALVIGIYGFINKKNHTDKRKIPWPSIVTLLFALAFCWLSFWGGALRASLPARLNPSAAEVSPSLPQTISIAGQTMKTSTKDALLGAGPNLFQEQWDLYRPASVIQSVFWNTDFASGFGLIPTFAVTEGVLGILTWMAFLALFLWLGCKEAFLKKQDLAARYLTLSSFLGALYLWTFTAVYAPSGALFFLGFIVTGVFVASLYETGALSGREMQYAKNKKFGFIVVLCLIVFLIASASFLFVVGEKVLAARDFSNGLTAANVKGDTVTAAADIRKAAALDPQDFYYQTLVQLDMAEINSIFSQQSATTTQGALLAQFQPVWTTTQGDLQKALVADPTDYQNYLLAGSVYEALLPLGYPNAFANANTAYQSALSLDPTNPLALLSLARLNAENTAADKNALTTAEQYIAQALKLKSNYTDVLYLQAQLDVNQNDLSDAIHAMTEISQINTTDPTVFYQLGYLQYLSRNYSAAIQSLGQAVSMENDYSNARYFLGLSYYQQGDVSDAIAQFVAVQKLNPTNQSVASILANLRAGKAPIPNETVATDKAASSQKLNVTPKPKAKTVK